MKYSRYNLVSIIYKDLYLYGRLQLLLLVLVLISAMLIVLVTYRTRCVVMCHEDFLLEKKYLDTEWDNLVLKEKILSNHSRVESIAVDTLNMYYADITQSNILMDL